ncbi:sigma-70 family RNA polymerase sigma factor [Ketogulonicigenium vulgare]|uniref:RNA polymerase sigma factor n=1 Tax=Ketogulonicigenium vulgare (strain WSH-001) TaxID=759362 RepID=F9Y625_KETVW|nr:sigma-70 family RNA polymerase sigma factor [Ketogulonicigenium vulgare]ADO42660.1 RNA polymerase sigma factor [Ketogulonicigenium vulgare Y25]AEM40850.1 RNA polymerase sigma factor [Ketogulonicigenium vulgare WSH-001]ALJ82312.1 RNA polymerase subunit sigma [Ketogulonicigenium vulgare]ANW33777.1 RNA polymerase subunit sigma [Ketogulonicigenium vulgare]AOZ54569.1 RNA polymerase sigma factor [Ketogulonicigenium vulgare]
MPRTQAQADAQADIEKLIMNVALRDRDAFDRLYAATSAKLFGTCLRVLKSRSEAEDAVQEIYVKIWLKADRFAVTQQSPMSWLIAVARYHAIDRLRLRRDATGALDDAAMDVRDPAKGPEAATVAAGERRQLYGCLDELETDRANAVRAAYLDGDSYADLAARHSVPLNTMRTWLRRSLMRLKECMQR